MEKSTIKKLLIGTIATVLAVCLLVVSGVFLNLLKERKEGQRISRYENAVKRIERRTEVVIPDDAEAVYQYYYSSDIYVSFCQYTAFIFTEQPTGFLEEYSFIEGPNKEVEDIYVKEFYFDWNDNPVPGKYSANLENKYFYYTKNNSIFFYFPDEQMLIVYIILE